MTKPKRGRKKKEKTEPEEVEPFNPEEVPEALNMHKPKHSIPCTIKAIKKNAT